MSDDRRAVPPAWEPRLTQDLAELVDAAATLAEKGLMRELPADFESLLADLAAQRRPR